MTNAFSGHGSLALEMPNDAGCTQLLSRAALYGSLLPPEPCLHLLLSCVPVTSEGIGKSGLEPLCLGLDSINLT